MKCLECKRELPIHAKGYCRRCYYRLRYATGQVKKHPRPENACPDCGKPKYKYSMRCNPCSKKARIKPVVTVKVATVSKDPFWDEDDAWPEESKFEPLAWIKPGSNCWHYGVKGFVDSYPEKGKVWIRVDGQKWHVSQDEIGQR